LPTGVFVTSKRVIGLFTESHQIGKERKGHGSKTAEAGENLLFVFGCEPLIRFNALQRTNGC
jgi:hypothetical protein